jgi:hypothetical protein
MLTERLRVPGRKALEVRIGRGWLRGKDRSPLAGAATIGLLASLLLATGVVAAASPSPPLGSHVLLGPTCVAPHVTCRIHMVPASGAVNNPITLHAFYFYPNDAYTVKLWNRVAGSGGTWLKLASGPTGFGAGASNFTAHFKVPIDPVGKYTVFVSDFTGDNVSAPFEITHLTPTPNSGAAGGSVAVKGSGFLPLATVSLTLAGTTLATVGGCSTNAHGVIIQGGSCVFKIPSLTAGSYKLAATDGKYLAKVTFTVT